MSGPPRRLLLVVTHESYRAGAFLDAARASSDAGVRVTVEIPPRVAAALRRDLAPSA